MAVICGVPTEDVCWLAEDEILAKHSFFNLSTSTHKTIHQDQNFISKESIQHKVGLKLQQKHTSRSKL